MTSNKELKTQQRNEVKERLKQIIQPEKKSKLIFEKLKEIERFKTANSIFCYISTNLEVSTEQIINYCFETNKRLSVPYTKEKNMYAIEYKSGDALVQNKYSILEPIYLREKEINDIDLIIVPMLGFEGVKRLGHGGGYYDKFMQRHPSGYKIGIAFEEQKIHNLVTEEHDIPLDMIITDKEIYKKWE